MGTPPEKPKPRINPLLEEDEIPIAKKPADERVVPEYVARHLRAAEQKAARDAKVAPPPRWPMVSGVWLFPFRLQSLEVSLFTTMGLLLSGWLLMFWLQYGAIGGATTAYYIGLPVCASLILTLGYLATSCLTIIESTAAGADSIEFALGLEWKEWIWNFIYLAVLAVQAGVVGFGAQLLCSTESRWPMIAVTFAVFPMILLAALAANGAWIPLAMGSVLRSLFQAGSAWGLFYVQTTPPIVIWCAMVESGLSGDYPWLTPLYAAPLLAMIVLIYVRLIGKLAGCISASTKKNITAGDDDEEQ